MASAAPRLGARAVGRCELSDQAGLDVARFIAGSRAVAPVFLSGAAHHPTKFRRQSAPFGILPAIHSSRRTSVR